MSRQVQVVSHDPMLLQTRRLILGAFFHAEGASRVREAGAHMSCRRYDLIILCYTLSESEQGQVMNLAAAQKHRPRILILTPAGSPPAESRSADAMMTEAGPYYLLKKSAEMLGVDIRLKATPVEV
jgi:DNA-binding response OmpR family regulator